MEIDGASSVKFEAVAKASASVQQQQSATSSSEKMCEVCKVVPYQVREESTSLSLYCLCVSQPNRF